MWNGEPDGDAWLIEVNPRFFGGLFQSIESGVDYPWLLFQLATDQELGEVVVGVTGRRTQVPVFGMISAVRDIDMELFSEMQNSHEQGWEQIKDGSIGEGLSTIARGINKGLSLPERIKRLKQFLDDNRDVRTEIFSTEDPQAALGILYGLASVIHTGKLPEQLKR
jgi:hypothetical protein